MCRPILLSILLAMLLLAGELLRAAEDVDTVAGLLELVIEVDADTAQQCLRTLTAKMQTGEVDAKQTAQLKEQLGTTIGKIVRDAKHPLFLDASLLAVSWRDAPASAAVRRIFSEGQQPPELRLRCLEALIAANDADAIALAAQVLADAKGSSPSFRGQLLAILGRGNNIVIAEVVLKNYANFEPELQPKAIELLTQRPAWSKSLLQAIRANAIPAAALNASQIVKLQTSGDEETKKLVVALWGTVRLERNPQREQVVAEMRKLLSQQRGDAKRGEIGFQKVCGQCHKIHGQGQEVGPDITANGRASFEQLLSNVFDPSLVIGASYQARVVVTEDGRILTGLIAEENEQRIVLKLQGGKVETIPRAQVEEVNISPLSLMPEGLEKQLTPDELRDLFAFLVLDKPPHDPTAQTIPGTPR